MSIKSEIRTVDLNDERRPRTDEFVAEGYGYAWSERLLRRQSEKICARIWHSSAAQY